MKCYTDAIELYPSSNCAHEVAACYANRAACHLKLVYEIVFQSSITCRDYLAQEEYQKVVDDCTKGIYSDSPSL